MLVRYDENFDTKRDARAAELVKLGVTPDQAQQTARRELLEQMAKRRTSVPLVGRR